MVVYFFVLSLSSVYLLIVNGFLYSMRSQISFSLTIKIVTSEKSCDDSEVKITGFDIVDIT